MLRSRPNIVLIVADDMGYGDFGAFSEGRCHTPAIDSLMAGGVSLTQHYSAAPVCAPARAALYTGRYPHRSGAIDTLEARGLDRIALRETTLADHFQRAGYRTGLIGKWHSGCGTIDPRFHPNRRGFDEFVGFQGGWQDFYRWILDANGRRRDSDGTYLTDVFTNEACDFIHRNARKPFFLNVAYNAPHFPLQAPEEEIRPYAETGRFTRAVSTIYAMNKRMDHGIGRILSELHKSGVADNTLVLFTSDNGPVFGGEGDNSERRFNCNFAGCKGNTYEGGIRVPMIARWADGLPAGFRCDSLVHFCDWLPTLLAVARIERPADILPLDGQNILPALRGEPQRTLTRRFWQWNRYTPNITCNAAMRDGRYKLVRPGIAELLRCTPEDGAMDAELKVHPERFTKICLAPLPAINPPAPPGAELYDLEADPFETCNLADTQPERVRSMLCALETWFESVEADRQTAVGPQLDPV